jgi:hypothetical protein
MGKNGMMMEMGREGRKRNNRRTSEQSAAASCWPIRGFEF